MSKKANPGELRTDVVFKGATKVIDTDGFESVTYSQILSAKVKWVNSHGAEAFTSLQLSLREPATLTCRYSPLINEQLLVYKGNDTEPYEIISIDNVEERNAWLEIHVQRRVEAR